MNTLNSRVFWVILLLRRYEKQFFRPPRRHEGFQAHAVRLKARKPSALENAERPVRT
ncbi:MAG: hypothetical protein LBF89_09655 [Bacteroidales bacterium]|nr:hypothetical protein [Bacteroidales bacterium]